MPSKSGNVSNTGIGKTKVSGDIGTNLDVTTGYIPGNLNRTIHLVSGASAQSAADDLTPFG